jgi:hypothetical protein
MKNPDIAEEMFKNLQKEKGTDKANDTHKLAVALLALNKAADILDNMKDFKSSERLTRIIEKLAKG